MQHILALAYRTLKHSIGPKSPNQPGVDPKGGSRTSEKEKSEQSVALKTFNELGSNTRIQTVVATVAALATATAVVRFNTIIHPFTLADNRHYMFYVFRYSILRAWWVRYALAPVYVLCGWLCWTALRGYGGGSGPPLSSSPPTSSTSTSTSPQTPSPSPEEWVRSPFTSASSSPPGRKQDSKQGDTTTTPTATTVPATAATTTVTTTTTTTTSPPPSSTALILLLSTALSLVTAPLVEPRYFILPWVFWRLYVPAWPQRQRRRRRRRRQQQQQQSRHPPSSRWVSGSTTTTTPPDNNDGDGGDDPRLLSLALELLWSAAVDAATMYVFLARPFRWWAADGTTPLDGGRAQRFMW